MFLVDTFWPKLTEYEWSRKDETMDDEAEHAEHGALMEAMRREKDGDGRVLDASRLIRARIAELEAIQANYYAYQADRVRERDHHSVRDVACDLELAEYEMVGLRFALKAMGEEG